MLTAFFNLAMTTLILTTALTVSAADSVGPRGDARATEQNVLSFKEWKSEKLQTCLSRITALQAEYRTVRAQVGQTGKAESLWKQISQEQWNLEVAKELSVGDYFALYLSQHQSANRFKAAAARLAPEEVAELMEAYSTSLAAGNPESASRLLRQGRGL